MPEDDKPNSQRFGDVRPDWLTTGSRKRKRHKTPAESVEAHWEEPHEPPSDHSKIWSLTWVSLTAVVAVAAVTGIALHFTDGSTITQETPPAFATEAERKAAATRTLHAFFAAESSAERLGFILDPDRLREPLEEFYRRTGAATATKISVDSLRFVLINDQPWFFAKLGVSGDQPQFVALKQTPSGYMLDWESLVAYGEMPWNALCTTRPEHPTQMRVYLSHTDYHNYKYSDRSRYAAYRISLNDGGAWLYGYVVRGSTTDLALSQIVKPNTRQPANIRLHFEPDAGADNLVVIDELIHPRWTHPSLINPAAVLPPGENALPPPPPDKAGG